LQEHREFSLLVTVGGQAMERWVEISFDCLPLRSVGRLDPPADASPKFRQRCERIAVAIAHHGTHNTYYIYNLVCRYHLFNHPELGMIEFRGEGTVLTDSTDLKTERCDLQLELARETCDWLTTPIVDWFTETAPRSIAVEFDRYIAAGDLQKAKDRLAKLQSEMEKSGGYVGMYL
jgi:hypothetical protein